uniref:Glutamine amidotransferase type-2 domain-containing protein n=1 Tax=Phytophthora ramorum TaxID=164328 RepID=H3G7C2_PHYRM
SEWTIAMNSAVLHLRGDQLVPQPVQDSAENVLCWNGEVFGLGGDISTDEEQDGDTLMHDMAYEEGGRGEDPVVKVLRRVKGPFAVVWLHEKTKRVYFAHDRFGRRSLLYRRWGNLMRFVLSSVAIADNDGDLSRYQELPASGIYVLDLRARPSTIDGDLPSYNMEFHPYAPLVPSAPLSSPTLPTQKTSSYLLDRFGSKLPCPVLTSETIQTAASDQENATILELSACALLVALSNAVGVRVRSIPPRPSSHGLAPTARVAVLFSGGLDSVVIAALTHFHVPVGDPVDLLTVCFDENSSFTSPDRRAAELAHAELCELFPERQWNLVQVNVPRTELARKQHEVQTLMAPCETHMDFNIGAAFWFLSRGSGELQNSVRMPENTHQTSARVVLVGIGADEQLAGYGRHRTALINGGEEALRAELQVDLGRIWKRNLGRDDRCIASHGREARFPYLDEDVVSTIAVFPVSSLCDADLPRGVGDKRALRVVAKTLGLRSCAGLAKRAIQFGSRIAKVSN